MSSDKTYPMLAVNVLVGVPFSGEKRVSLRNDFGIEKGCQSWKFARESSNL